MREIADALRAQGFHSRAVAQALGIIDWNGPDLDGMWWRRRCVADGALGALVELFVRGSTVARPALPDTAWSLGLLEETTDGTRATGTLLPLGDDLVCTDRADRAFVGDDGVFLPDSTTLALRRCIQPARVARHLDLGAGGGAVAVRAARFADATVALDLNPRAVTACAVTADLNEVSMRVVTGRVADAAALGRFDRVSFVLPLLVPWTGLAAAPIHTVAAHAGLLAEVIGLLPRLLSPGGVALLYTQAHGPVRSTLGEAFGDRPYRAAFWWDYVGDTSFGELRAGVLAVRADAQSAWIEAPNTAPDVGVGDWWPYLAAVLG